MVGLGLILSIFLLLAYARDSSVFLVYRSTTTTSEYYTHLVNANAADKAGALSYLHTEVLPQGSHYPTCARKWNYDIMAIYEVTVSNPTGYSNGPNIGGGFSAMDSGKCTVPNCQANFEKNGFFVGGQTQKGNCRAAYGDVAGSAYWYSFPAEGQCAKPDGSKRCTYTARYIGKIKLDDLVNSEVKQIVPNYHDWCMKGGLEFEAEGTGCPSSCNVKTSVEFWKGPCDVAKCQRRVDKLQQATTSGNLVNYTLDNGCDGSTLKTFKYNGQCVRDCPPNTYLDWSATCVACNPGLNCASCNWATTPPSIPAGQGGTRCVSCLAGSVLASGRCVPSGLASDDDGEGEHPVPASVVPVVITVLVVLLVLGAWVVWRVRVHRKQRMLDSQLPLDSHEMGEYLPPR